MPGVRKDLSPSRTVVLAGMMPGKFVDEIRFHKTHKDEALSYCSEWYAGDSVAVQELLAWSFDFPEMFYTERPRGSKYNWLLRAPGKTWHDQMLETMLPSKKKI